MRVEVGTHSVDMGQYGCFIIWFTFKMYLHSPKCDRTFKVHCGMYIPLSDDKHRFVRDSSLCALEIQDNI